MNIPEYYLHMFCGVNGSHDDTTGAGRIAIAALMAGSGLTGSTKRDLQTRIGWETTPGCMLGTKEFTEESYGVRTRPHLKFLNKLMIVKKAARTLNFTLNWAAIEEETNFKITDPAWIAIARIYWLGRFMFGRNVIPETVMTTLRECFDTATSGVDNLRSHYIMQFFLENDFFANGVPTFLSGTFTPVSVEVAQTMRFDRHDVFLSLAVAMNASENTVGFYATSAAIPLLVEPGTSFRSLHPAFEIYDESRPQGDRSYRGPQRGSYYDQYTVGTPAVSNLARANPGSNPKDLVALLYCNRDMTPQEQAQHGHTPVMGYASNPEVYTNSIAGYVTTMMLFEYHLLLSGRELVPLSSLKQARERAGWDAEELLRVAPSLYTLNNRNSTIHHLIRFNLARQNLV